MASDVAGLGRRRGVLAQARLGPAVMKEYFEPDLSVVAREYTRFVEQVASSRRWVTQHSSDSEGVTVD